MSRITESRTCVRVNTELVTREIREIERAIELKIESDTSTSGIGAQLSATGEDGGTRED